jgi:putative hydrolase
MKYIVDTHSHTIASGHAYSTITENAKAASEKGIKILAITDHGPSFPGGPHEYYFANMKVLPRELMNVTLLRGCEANIINFEGNIDISEWLQQKLDIIIASLHEPCIKPGNKDENTKAILGAIENPNIHIIGHLGNPVFPIWEEEIIKEAKRKDVIIEINNGSFSSRKGSEENCKKIAALCKEYGVKVALGSDAHFYSSIGDFSKAEEILKFVNMPEELIINSDEFKLMRYLIGKGKL